VTFARCNHDIELRASTLREERPKHQSTYMFFVKMFARLFFTVPGERHTKNSNLEVHRSPCGCLAERFQLRTLGAPLLHRDLVSKPPPQPRKSTELDLG